MKLLAFSFTWITLFTTILSTTKTHAAESTDYSKVIAPIFKTYCVKCHGPAKAEGKLDLSSPAMIAKGGKSGPAISAHDIQNSRLWERLDSDEMPPKKPLSTEHKATIKKWIQDGSPGLQASGSSTEHWAFRARKRPEVPKVKDATSLANPIDAFIAFELEKQGDTSSPITTRSRLIRRVALSVTGLPPTPEELEKFLNDKDINAYQNMIDSYLKSPHYGERWGKYWLDAAGYTDSNGYFNADSDRPLAYKYRDYVIRSLNNDKPFDRFLQEQLAGDEIVGDPKTADKTPETIDQLIATHFLRNGQDGSGESDGNPEEVRVDRYTALESCQQMIGSALLGLTIQCAKCHTHKFEPITHEDYYRFQAILYPVFPARDEKLWLKPNNRFVLAPLKGEQEAWDKAIKSLETQVATAQANYRVWSKANRPGGEVLFFEDFDKKTSLSGEWSNQAPCDDKPGGRPPVTLDSNTTPAARVHEQHLEIIAGKTLDSWISTKQKFDWSPDQEGDVIQVTFDLIDNKLSKDGKPAERVGYFLATHDFDDSGKVGGGNILIDGHPTGASSVHVDYPGKDDEARGSIGASGYVPGNNFGARISNVGKGKYKLEHLMNGAVDGGSIVLSDKDLPDGGFGFEYHADRSFIVDNVRIERFTHSNKAIANRLSEFTKQNALKRKDMDEFQNKLRELRKNPPGKIAWATDLSSTPPETLLLLRGDNGKPGAAMTAGPLAMLSSPKTTFGKPLTSSSKTTGRRLGFARWLTDPNERASALLARVQVNRIWMHYFGTGIVATPENLGLSGAEPSNRDLLDWLAFKFIESGWSLKHIHRLILTSQTFQQESLFTDQKKKTELSLSLFPAIRLDSEAIRDSMLAVSGDLDRRMYGPTVPFTARDDGAVVISEKQPGGHRRTIYLKSRRTQVLSLLQVFDSPSIVYNSVQRPRTAMPLQTLALLNSDFVRARATSFAARLERESSEPKTRIERAFLLAFARKPSTEEVTSASEFVRAQIREYGSDPAANKKALIDLCQSLLISNEFLYVD